MPLSTRLRLPAFGKKDPEVVVWYCSISESFDIRIVHDTDIYNDDSFQRSCDPVYTATKKDTDAGEERRQCWWRTTIKKNGGGWCKKNDRRWRTTTMKETNDDNERKKKMLMKERHKIEDQWRWNVGEEQWTWRRWTTTIMKRNKK